MSLLSSQIAASRNRWLFVLSWVVLLSAFAPLPPILAFAPGNPDLVGVLAKAVEPAVAAQLDLTDDQVRELESFINQREGQALGLAQQLRQMPKSVRAEKRREFVRDSERGGMAILTMSQRSRLEEIRLTEIGLLSIGEEAIAQTLDLSEGQREQVESILSKEAEVAREFGRDKVVVVLNEELKKVLTSSQYATWQAMAGMSARVSAGQSSMESAPSEMASGASAGDEVSQDGTLAGVVDDGGETDGGETDGGETDGGETDGSELGMGESDGEQAALTNDMELANSELLTGPMKKEDAVGSQRLTINFDGAGWEEVLGWLAQEAGLSLQVDTFPVGTFSYRDTARDYTLSEAMDVMNSVLLGKGYTLVRRQRVLMVIDLGAEDSAEVTRGLVRELAELVSPEGLDSRGEFELLKCLFVLSRMSTEEAQTEIESLLGPQGSVIVLPTAGQILVTETAGKLRLIREMLDRVENPENSRGSTIVSFPLKHVTAEEVLAVARPLVGLEEGENTSEGLNVSTDTFGNVLYATGDSEKIQKLKDVVSKVDMLPSEDESTAVVIATPRLQSHPLMASDPQTTFDVLSTLLAGTPGVRMTLDPVSSRIIAFAVPEDQELIQRTIADIAGERSSFEIIPLKRLDPQAVLLTLEKFYGKPKTGEGDAVAGSTGPTFYADSAARNVMVQGTEAQVAKVRQMINDMEDNGTSSSVFGEKMRFLPMNNRSADRLLEQLESLWGLSERKNRLNVIVPSSSSEVELPGMNLREAIEQEVEREYSTSNGSASRPRNPDRDNQTMLLDPPRRMAEDIPAGRWTSYTAPQEPSQDSEQESGGSTSAIENKLPADITVYRGPNGLIVTSDDSEALADFDELVRLLQDNMALGAEPSVVYLKYVRAGAASELLNQILSGESGGGGGGGLLGQMASGMLGEMGGGMLGGLLGGAGGGAMSSSGGLASDDYSIVADPRLNALIIKATPVDMDLIEQLLQIIDQEDSPLLVETYGKPRLIQVIYMDVNEVANIVKSVYADRLAGAEGGGGGAPSPQQLIEALRGGGGAGGGSSELKENTITVSADVASNTLIISSSLQVFEEIEALVAALDQNNVAEQDETVIVPLGGNINPEVIKTALESMMGGRTDSSKSSSTTSTGSSSSVGAAAPQAFDPNEIRRRIEAFRSMQGRFGGGRGGDSGRGGRSSRGGRGG